MFRALPLFSVVALSRYYSTQHSIDCILLPHLPTQSALCGCIGAQVGRVVALCYHPHIYCHVPCNNRRIPFVLCEISDLGMTLRDVNLTRSAIVSQALISYNNEVAVLHCLSMADQATYSDRYEERL